MARWTLPLLFALAACESQPANSPWINSNDPAPLREKLAAWKGRKAVLLEFSFLA